MRTDEELMAAYVANDDSDAFREIHARYAERLTRMFRARGLSDGDARDLAQQTFLHLHRARRDFRAGARLRPWLYTIALNVRREYFRRSQRRPETALDAVAEPSSAAPHTDPARNVQAAELRRALAALPENQSEVIALHWFEGLTFPEIGAILGASVSAVKVRAHRGYEALRKRLGDTVKTGERG